MRFRIAPIVLLAAVLGAGALALLRSGPSANVDPAPEPPPAPEPAIGPHAGDLPPNHPPIGDPSSPRATAQPARDESAAAITWQVPAPWKVAPNPSQMRLATYRVAEDTEMSVARAGGTTDANIERWAGQFEDTGPAKRMEKAVRGLKVTVIEISGTYRGGGMMPGAAPAQHRGWTLLAAIVEVPGPPYFFKLIGPQAAVRAARGSFDELIGSISPK